MQIEEDFFKKYQYNKDVVSAVFDDDQRGMLETYGADLLLAQQINEMHPHTFWSMIDGEDNNLHIVAGMYDGDVVYYVITVQEWTDPDEDYIFATDEENLQEGDAH